MKNGIVGTSYSVRLSATGSSVKWSRTAGTLPSGVSLSSAGKITGSPKKAGTYNFTVRAKNSGGADEKALTLTVVDAKPKIKTTSLAKGTVGKAHSATLKVSAGTGITWSVGGGKLPDGLTLNSSTGKLSGRPTKAGKFSVTFKVTNSGGTASKKLKLVVSKAKSKATTADLNVLSGDEVLDGDLVEVEPEQAVPFVIGPWTDANGEEVTVTNLKVYAADELTGIETDADVFTLPESMLDEGDEFSVYVTAEADGQLLKSKEVYVIVRDGALNFPTGASQTEASRNDNHKGCDMGLAGICTLTLLALLKRR